MPLRRAHRKSRSGCLECKRRRVKCDELRPNCSNCLKRKEECEYPAPSFVEWGKDQPKGSPYKRPRASPSASSEENPFSTLERLRPNNHGSGLVTDLNLTQLELMIHWCHVTYKSLSRNASTAPVWAQYLPEEATTRPFLMHGILSLSALHLARLKPESRALYLNLSVAHQDPGLSVFREQLLQITPENASAMFAFSGMVVAFAFGYSVTATPDDQVAEVHTASLGELFRILVLARGVSHISKVAVVTLKEGVFAPVLDFDEGTTVMPADVTVALGKLESLNRQYQAGNDQENIDAYQKAIDSLRSLSFTVYAGEHPTMTLAVGWAIRLPPKVLKDMQMHEPLSLVILAHYCVFLHVERGHWCLDHWGATVMHDIWQLLDDSWRPHVHWAMSKISEPT